MVTRSVLPARRLASSLASLALSVLVLLGLAGLAGCKPITIEGELAKLTAGDREALNELLAGSGVAPTQLVPVGFGVLQYHPRAISVDEGRIVELRISDAHLGKTAPLARLTGLRALWLSGDGIDALPDLAGLASLETLDLGHNAIKDLKPLARLQKLSTLRVGDNQVSDLGPLTPLPALQTIEAMGNPLEALPTPTPKAWTVKADGLSSAPPAPRVEHPAGWVAKTPPTTGKAGAGSVGGLINGSGARVKGTVSTLQGAVDLGGIQGQSPGGGALTLELQVERGRVRAYLEYFPPGGFASTQDGYVVAEATPGAPGKVTGNLPTPSGSGASTRYHFVIESLDGEAQGIGYRIDR